MAYRKHTAIMVLCFLFGGFSIILYLLQFSLLFRTSFVSGIRPESGGFPPMPILEYRGYPDNSTNASANQSPAYERRGFVRDSPANLFLSPFSLILLCMGIISTAAGFAIHDLVRKREIDFAKKVTRDIFLTPDEKAVVSSIEGAGGSLAQSEITKRTGLSRVKVHRVIRNLESKGLIMKMAFGMTNKIAFREAGK